MKSVIKMEFAHEPPFPCGAVAPMDVVSYVFEQLIKKISVILSAFLFVNKLGRVHLAPIRFTGILL